ncbi:MAG: glycosyltransferase [Pseudomonadota bacterium]
MKLAFLNYRYRPGATNGGNVHVAQFVSNAVALGHEVWMDADHRHELAKPLPHDDLLDALDRMDVVYIRVDRGFPEICGQIDRARHDRFTSTLVVWEFNAPPSYAGLRGATDAEIDAIVDKFRQHRAACDLAIGVSRSLTEQIQELLGLQHTVTISNGSDPALFRPDAPPQSDIATGPDTLNVVWVGSAHIPWHDLDLVRQAAERLWQRHQDSRIRFHIIGRGLARADEWPENVVYHGPIPYDRLPHWLAAMDVGLVLYRPGPADYNSPLKLFDYMASGLAVVGSKHPQMGEVFSACDPLDLMLPDNAPATLADRLLQLHADRDRVATLGRSARRLIVEKYNWTRSVSDTLDAIRLHLERKRRGV